MLHTSSSSWLNEEIYAVARRVRLVKTRNFLSWCTRICRTLTATRASVVRMHTQNLSHTRARADDDIYILRLNAIFLRKVKYHSRPLSHPT